MESTSAALTTTPLILGGWGGSEMLEYEFYIHGQDPSKMAALIHWWTSWLRPSLLASLIITAEGLIAFVPSSQNPGITDHWSNFSDHVIIWSSSLRNIEVHTSCLSLFISTTHSLPKYLKMDRQRLIENEAITSRCLKNHISSRMSFAQKLCGRILRVFST